MSKEAQKAYGQAEKDLSMFKQSALEAKPRPRKQQDMPLSAEPLH